MADSVKFSVCPYNKQHKMTPLKLPVHILKCRKNYTGSPLEKCIYNATHLVLPREMQEHLAACRDRHLFHICDYEQSFRKDANF